MTANNKVVRLSLKQLGCAEDYERPAVGTRHPTTMLPPARRPHDDDDDEADVTGGLRYSDESALGTRPSQDDRREEASPMPNDVEVILNQRKSIEKDSSASPTRLKPNADASTSVRDLAEYTLVSFLLVLCVLASNRCR